MKRTLWVAGLAVGVAAAAALAWWTTRDTPVAEVSVDTPTPRDHAPDGAPNVVVVLGCTLRRDQLTPYGGPPDTTPFLSEIAGEGVRFDDLIASSSWTKESSTALFTGHQAAAVGMIEPSTHHSVRRLADRVDTLAERLHRAGWATLGVTANPHLNAAYGLAQGFDRYHDTVTKGFAQRNKLHGTEVVSLALDMLDARSDDERARPFYARLVLIDPHVPLSVREHEVEPFLADAPTRRVATYRAGVKRVDDALRQLDAGLRERGYTPENTLFVLVTDHGEGLGQPEHHRAQHGRVLYRTLTQVPWILRGPGVARGHVVPGLTSHLDVAPTLLGLLGLDHDLEGRDLSAQVRGGTQPTGRDVAFTETWYFGANRAAAFTAGYACQRDWGSKQIPKDTFEDGCFDRQRDPDFTRVIERPALAEELVRWRTEQQAAYEAWPDTADAVDDADSRKQLEALGYIESHHRR